MNFLFCRYGVANKYWSISSNKGKTKHWLHGWNHESSNSGHSTPQLSFSIIVLRKYGNTINGFCGIIFRFIVAVCVEYGCNTVTIEKLVNTSVLKTGNVKASKMKAEIFFNCIICYRSAESHFHFSFIIFKNSLSNLFLPSLVSITGFDLD